MSLKSAPRNVPKKSLSKASLNRIAIPQRPSKILATVSINLGWESDNPILRILSDTNIHVLVTNFIAEYHLPAKVYSIITDKIHSELDKENLTPNTHNHPHTNRSKTPRNDKNKAKRQENKKSTATMTMKTQRSQIDISNRSKSRKHTPLRLKTVNNKYLEKSPSPIARKSNRKAAMNVDQRCSEFKDGQKASKGRSAEKIKRQSLPLKKDENNPLVQLFMSLTRKNPSHVKILTPQYISFEKLGPDLLAILQFFFETLSDDELEDLTASKFCQKIREQKLQEMLLELLEQRGK